MDLPLANKMEKYLIYEEKQKPYFFDFRF